MNHTDGAKPGQRFTTPHTPARPRSATTGRRERAAHSFEMGDLGSTITVDVTGAEEGAKQPRVLVIYEDLKAGLRAWHAFHRVMHQLDCLMDVTVNLWRFDLIGDPVLSEHTLEEAATADIVLLAAQGESRLPEAVNCWLRKWLENPGNKPSALAMSFDAAAGTQQHSHYLGRALQAMVPRAGVDLILNAEAEFAMESERDMEGARHSADPRTFAGDQWPQPFVRPPYRGWGINE